MQTTEFNDGWRLNPLRDILFLKFMGEKGREKQLLGLINSILEYLNKPLLKKIEIIENRELTGEYIRDKKNILDIRAQTKNKKVNIEIQQYEKENMGKRSLSYWAREYGNTLIAGDNYNQLPIVICINILNYKYIRESDSFITSHSIYSDNNKNEPSLKDLEIYFIDMTKFRKTKKDINNSLHRWLIFLDPKATKKDIKTVIKMDENIKLADKTMEHFSQDKETIRQYQLREMAMSDITTLKDKATKDGIKKGKIEAASKMKKKNYSLNDISEITGLSVGEIKKL